jgi:hypothetical protein
MSIYDKAFRVRVTKKDCKRGEKRSCFRCPVALALQRATGDSEANVFEMDWQLYLEACGRLALAPQQVVQFIWDKDADLDPEPISFDLPPIKDWKEKCCQCQDIFEQVDLDRKGFCEECRQ